MKMEIGQRWRWITNDGITNQISQINGITSIHIRRKVLQVIKATNYLLMDKDFPAGQWLGNDFGKRTLLTGQDEEI